MQTRRRARELRRDDDVMTRDVIVELSVATQHREGRWYLLSVVKRLWRQQIKQDVSYGNSTFHCTSPPVVAGFRQITYEDSFLKIRMKSNLQTEKLFTWNCQLCVIGRGGCGGGVFLRKLAKCSYTQCSRKKVIIRVQFNSHVLLIIFQSFTYYVETNFV